MMTLEELALGCPETAACEVPKRRARVHGGAQSRPPDREWRRRGLDTPNVVLSEVEVLDEE